MNGRDAGDSGRPHADSRAGRPGADEHPSDDASVGDPRPLGDRSARVRRDETVRIEDGLVRWFLETDDRTVSAVRVVLASLAIVAIVGLLLFLISGQFPVLVAIESGSMTPNMHAGDIVFVVEEGRFAGDGAVEGTGVVTLEQGRENGYRKFGKPGDVIVFRPNGDPTATPVIHRAHFWVEAGENWVQTTADPGSLEGATCADIRSCPAPHDGFVTKGDANPAYDQLPRSGSETTVVSPDWVTGKAMFKMPQLGMIRLLVDSIRSAVGLGSIIGVVLAGAVALLLFGALAGSDRGGS
ncbi:S26 family signal peptidase [Natrinema marinum]|uniref:S26 family signal peptidase n=1 Tax=Natrinema marinum TaxID=2961598 RepID=UPI0020C8883C|nr:S26 family signal peptidase [Natrinema marinum]